MHILKGEYPVKPGLIVGHEPVGTIEALGAGVTGFARRATASSSARSRRVVSAARASAATALSAATAATASRRSAAGASGTRSTAARPSTSLVPERAGEPREASRRSSTTRTWCCAATSCRPGSRRPSARACASATPSPCSRRARSASARRPARASRARRSSSASTACPRAWRWRSAWARTSCSTPKQQDVVAEIRRLTGGGADVAIEALGHAIDVRELRSAASGPAGRSRASACTRGI